MKQIKKYLTEAKAQNLKEVKDIKFYVINYSKEKLINIDYKDKIVAKIILNKNNGEITYRIVNNDNIPFSVIKALSLFDFWKVETIE